MMPKKPVLFLLLGLTIFMAVLYATAGSRVPETSAQATNQLSLRVESARTEPDAPGGPVNKGDEVTEYQYLINVDNTGDPIQPR